MGRSWGVSLVRTALLAAGCLWVALVPVSVAAQAGPYGAEEARPDGTWVTDWLNRIDQEFSRDIVRKLAQPAHGAVGTKVAQKTESRPGAPGEVRRDAGAEPGHGFESQVADWVERVQEWLARAASTTQGKIMRPLSSPGPEAPRQDEVAGLTAEAAAKLKRDLMDRKRYDGDEASVQRAEADRRAAEARQRETEEVLKRDLLERKKYDLNLVGQAKPDETPAAVSGAPKQDAEDQLKRDLAERRRVEEAEAEAKRKAAEQAAAAKAAEDRRLADEAEAKRKAAEQAAAAKAAEDKRLADAAEAKRKAAEQAAAAKAAEDKRLADAAEAKRKAAEQAAAEKIAEDKRLADAREAKRIADEKAAAPKVDPAKRWIEAETMRRNAEQKAREADRKRAAEEADAKRKTEEADAKRQVDEARRKLDEAKRKAEDDAAKAAEAKRLADEAQAKRKADAARMGAAASRLGDKMLAQQGPKGDTKGGTGRAGGKGQAVVEEGSTDRDPAEAAAGKPGRKGKHARKAAKVARHEDRCRNAGRRVKPPATYVVAKGDTLWDIAATHYRAGSRYPVIYRANRSKIDDPDLIYPCQRLFLPARRR